MLRRVKMEPFNFKSITNNLTTSDIQKKLPPVLKEQSSYFNQYYTGENKDRATKIADFMTWNHSEKIKAGNQLENLIYEDISSLGFNVYKNIKIGGSSSQDLSIDKIKETFKFPCLIMKAIISKELYLKNNQICQNKKANEIDFIWFSNNADANIFEIKNGCNFDTKKSKGEVQSLTATKNVFENEGFAYCSTSIVCYDANTNNISFKTELDYVKLLLYEEMCTIMDINGTESRTRIDKKIQEYAEQREIIALNAMRDIINNS
jgi:hypothetical protein